MEQHSEKLAKHEVLKMCEGVGKILLREPDEVISMFPAKAKGEKGSGATDDGNLFYFYIFSLLLLYSHFCQKLCVCFFLYGIPAPNNSRLTICNKNVFSFFPSDILMFFFLLWFGIFSLFFYVEYFHRRRQGPITRRDVCIESTTLDEAKS